MICDVSKQQCKFWSHTAAVSAAYPVSFKSMLYADFRYSQAGVSGRHCCFLCVPVSIRTIGLLRQLTTEGGEKENTSQLTCCRPEHSVGGKSVSGDPAEAAASRGAVRVCDCLPDHE